MLIPIADVPRWYAERKPKDTIAVSHGADTLTWEQLERNANAPRPRLCGQGRQAGRFRRHRAAQQQRVFRDHLCGVEMRRDADVADLAVAARRGRRGAGDSQAFAGGRRPAGLECAEFAAGRFRAGGFFGRTDRQPGGALLEGDDLRRLDRAAEGDPRSSARRDRYRRPSRARHADRRVPAQPRPALPQRARSSRRTPRCSTAGASPASSNSTPRNACA